MTDKATKLHRKIPRAVLQRTACHKAGHAVIGRVLGQACEQVMIERDSAEPETRRCSTAVPWTTMGARDAIGPRRDYDTIMHGRIMTCMAGAEAEHVLLGGAADDREDRRQVELMLSTLHGDAEEARMWEQRLRRHTRRLVRRHAARIELVAEALLLRRQLQGPQIDGLLAVSEIASGAMNYRRPHAALG